MEHHSCIIDIQMCELVKLMWDNNLRIPSIVYSKCHDDQFCLYQNVPQQKDLRLSFKSIEPRIDEKNF